MREIVSPASAYMQLAHPNQDIFRIGIVSEQKAGSAVVEAIPDKIRPTLEKLLDVEPTMDCSQVDWIALQLKAGEAQKGVKLDEMFVASVADLKRCRLEEGAEGKVVVFDADPRDIFESKGHLKDPTDYRI